jgi:hypothetical protein
MAVYRLSRRRARRGDLGSYAIAPSNAAKVQASSFETVCSDEERPPARRAHAVGGRSRRAHLRSPINSMARAALAHSRSLDHRS